jgi:dolichol kinase
MVYNCLTVPVTIFYIANGFVHLSLALKLKKKYPDHNLINSILIFILWIVAGIVFPLFFFRDSSQVKWFEGLAFQIICIYAPLLILFILYYQYQFVLKKTPSLRKKRTIENFMNNFTLMDLNNLNDRKTALKIDFHRKAFHLLPAVIIIFLWLFAVYIWDGMWNADQFWGISGPEYGIFLILTVGYTGVIIFATLDYLRLSHIFNGWNFYHLMPTCISNTLGKTLKKNEIYEFTRPVALVLSLVPTLFLPFGIFTAAALIATLGDGAASIFGLRFGRIHLPKHSNKTLIGYISGFIASLGISILALWLFEQQNFTIIQILIISFSGALTFLIIDILNLKIDDNILNPIFCAYIMALISVLL